MTPLDDLITAYNKLYRENSMLRLQNLQLTQQLAEVKRGQETKDLLQVKEKPFKRRIN